MHPHDMNSSDDADGITDDDQERNYCLDRPKAVDPHAEDQPSYRSTTPIDQAPEDSASPASEPSTTSSTSLTPRVGNQLAIGGIVNTGYEVQSAKTQRTEREESRANHVRRERQTETNNLAPYSPVWGRELEKQKAAVKKANKKYYEAFNAKIANRDPEAIARRKRYNEQQKTYRQELKRSAAEGDEEAHARYEKQKQRKREAWERKKTTQPTQREGFVDQTASSPQNHSRLHRSAPDPAASQLLLPKRPVAEAHWPADQRSMTGIHDRREGPVDVQGTGQRRQEVNGVQIDQGSDWYTTDGDTTGSLSSPISPRYQGHKGR